MRRSVLLLLVLGLVVPALPATAQTADLSDYFSRAAKAEYSGDQVLTCRTPVGLRDSAARVAQKAGKIYVTAGVDGAPTISAGAGLLAASGPGGAAKSIQIVAATEPPSGYKIAGVEAVTYLDREASRVSLSTGGKARVRMTFDDATGALLRSETLNGDGSVYCTTRLTSFNPESPDVRVANEENLRKISRVSDFADTTFPARLGGFRRLDVYGWNEVGQMAYYSDGFFAFALYNVTGRFSVDSVDRSPGVGGKARELPALVPAGDGNSGLGQQRRGYGAPWRLAPGPGRHRFGRPARPDSAKLVQSDSFAPRKVSQWLLRWG